MSRLHRDLLLILDAVRIESTRRYTVLEEPRAVPADSEADPESRIQAGPLVTALADDLYERLYIRPSPSPQSVDHILARRDHLAALSEANTGRGQWESGWTIVECGGGEPVATKDGLFFRVPRSHLQPEDDTFRPGQPCRVLVPKELRGLIAGFYVALGDAGGPSKNQGEDMGPTLRYYWHLEPQAAASFVATATALSNEVSLPFRLKVPSDPNAYSRADAGVMYVRGRDLALVGPVVTRIHATIAHLLRPDVPLFTRRLGHGLGFAEDVTGPESFGQHRCRLVAQGLWQAFERGEMGRSARIAALAAAFSEAGLDALQPHRGPGWRPEFEPEPLETARSSRIAGAVRRRSSGRQAPARLSPLEAAARIGQALGKSAYWDADERLCNWFSRSPTEFDPDSRQLTPTWAALGPFLYSGSAGIALFLTHLHRLTGDPDLRRTGLAGIARSIRQLRRPTTADSLPPLSFHFGDLGIAYAAWAAAEPFGCADLLAEVATITASLGDAIAAPHDVEVIGGNAGAIPALLAMGRTRGLGECRELAIVLGEELCQVDLTRSGVLYAREDRSNAAELVHSTPSGLSHGASGIGAALLELHAATGRTGFRDAARRAFEYEDTLFDADRGNWADLRRPDGPSRHEIAWCNGAPGIALARLRAAVLDQGRRDDYLAMARVGIATTIEAIEKLLAMPRYDATPCHGLSGLIEIVWVAGRMLDDASCRDQALAAAQVLIDRYSDRGDWPSGLYSGRPNPSLMLGTAGIGYTFLRLHDPENVPSVLWIGC